MTFSRHHFDSMAERLPGGEDFLGQRAAEVADLTSKQRRLWSHFQNTATSLTHLYRSRTAKNDGGVNEDQEAWLAFQSAAASLTSLYRESADILTNSAELNKRLSYPPSATLMASDPRKSPEIVVTVSSKPSTDSTVGVMTTSVSLQGGQSMMMSANSPPFDFLHHHHHSSSNNQSSGNSRVKRSFSPNHGWDEDDMDLFSSAKKRKFL